MAQRPVKAKGRGGRGTPRRGRGPSFRIVLWAIALPAVAAIFYLAWLGLRVTWPDIFAPEQIASDSHPPSKIVWKQPKPKKAPPQDDAPAVAGSSAESTPRAGGRTGGRIALILDDVGFEGQAIEAAADLEANITFAVIPFTPSADRSAKYLTSRGFELLCHLPMEPVGYPGIKPGEGAVLVSMSDEEIASTTLAAIAAVPGAVGLNNHMGSRATADERIMRAALNAVRERNLYFIDSRTSQSSVAAAVARNLEIATASRDVFLDDSRNRDEIRKQIRRLAATARERKVAVGIGHVYPETIAVLTEEIPRLRREGFVFVRASSVVR